MVAHGPRKQGDLDAATANHPEACSLSDDPTLSLALGWPHREIGRPGAESLHEFQRAVLGLGTSDRILRPEGLSYLLELVEAPQVLSHENLAGAWRKELDRLVRGVVSSFEGLVIAQFQPPGVPIAPRWARPLSAATNTVLDGRVVAAVSEVSSSGETGRCRNRARGLTRQAEMENRELTEAANWRPSRSGEGPSS